MSTHDRHFVGNWQPYVFHNCQTFFDFSSVAFDVRQSIIVRWLNQSWYDRSTVDRRSIRNKCEIRHTSCIWCNRLLKEKALRQFHASTGDSYRPYWSPDQSLLLVLIRYPFRQTIRFLNILNRSACWSISLPSACIQKYIFLRRWLMKT